ncbi:hypothetical protein NFI96_032630 [Prochilodus magdalenae]|nr:hypothetical protein NFI96_032630 [Prochilodus magdalenae]
MQRRRCVSRAGLWASCGGAGRSCFWQREGQVWSEELQCRGNESQIHLFQHHLHLKHTCSHDNDVGLVCAGHTGARLVNGSDSCSGRVELPVPQLVWGGSGWIWADVFVRGTKHTCQNVPFHHGVELHALINRILESNLQW